MFAIFSHLVLNHNCAIILVFNYFITIVLVNKLIACFLQILPGLYIGNFRDSKDCKQLDGHRITHILSIHDDAKKLFKVSQFNPFKSIDVEERYTCKIWYLKDHNNTQRYHRYCKDVQELEGQS